MTRQEMLDTLKAGGVKKAFKPYREEGRVMPGQFLLKTKPAFDIVDGRLVGGEIVFGGGDFLVWTPKTRLANRLAAQHKLAIRRLDGEAELHVPASLADALLPSLGAIVKRACQLTQQQREARCAKMRLARQKSFVEGSSSTRPKAEGSELPPQG